MANDSKKPVESKKPTLAAATPNGKPVVEPAPIVPPVDVPKPKPEPSKPKPKPEPAKPKPKPEPEEMPKPTPTPEKPPEKPPEVKKPVETPAGKVVTFAKDVLPVFKDKCSSCHNGSIKKNGLDLSTLALTTQGGNGGPGLKAGDPDTSYIWESIKDGTMPPDGKPKLTEDEKKLIYNWIKSGAK